MTHLRLASPVLALVAFGLAGCSGPTGLVVDVRTDLVPGVEFALVETTIEGPGVAHSAMLSANLGEPYARGMRVSELFIEDAREVLVTVRLLGAAGEEILTRRVMASLDVSLAVTVVMTRDCLEVSCPGGADAPSATECVSGVCVTPGCGLGGVLCLSSPECVTDTDCTAESSCSVAFCAEGACLAAPDETLCGAGEFCHPESGCEALPAPDLCQMCGDVNGDGRLNITDVTIISLAAAGRSVSAPCMALGNIFTDGAVTERDAVGLSHHLFSGTDGSGLCESCDRGCGDVNGDDVVDAADVVALTELQAGERTLTPCVAWAADVDGDTDLASEDVSRLQEVIDSGAALECVP